MFNKQKIEILSSENLNIDYVALKEEKTEQYDNEKLTKKNII